MSARPAVTVSLPAELADFGLLRAGLIEMLNAVVRDPDPLDATVEPSDDGVVRICVDQRPALVGLLRDPSSDDELVDEVSSRLLRRLPLWYAGRGLRDGARHYLADLGRDVPWLTTDHSSTASWLDEAERVLNDATSSLTIEVPAYVARRISHSGLSAMARLRRELFERTGVNLPDVGVVLTEPTLRRIRLRLNDVAVTVRHVPPDADWTDVVGWLARVVEPRMHWFLRMSEVDRALDDLSYLVPDLVGAVRACYSIETLTATVRLLLRHGANSRNLSRVLWLLLELGTAESGADHFLMAETPLLARSDDDGRGAGDDPIVLMSRVRKRIAEEAWRVGLVTSPDPSGRLSAGVEELLAGSPGPAERAHAEWRAIEEFVEIGGPSTVVVRSMAAIGPVFDVLQAVPEPPVVIAAHELPPDVVLSSVRVASESR